MLIHSIIQTQRKTYFLFGNTTGAILLALFLAFSFPCRAAGDLIQPDSAIASSEFSANFDIGNVIDGSGLTADFGPTDPHAEYANNNSWTTEANQVLGANATFFFNDAVTIDKFYMWNHPSTLPFAHNSFYEVTVFDLILSDAGGSALLTLNDLAAVGETDIAQVYSFAPVSGVRSVDFIIDQNQGLLQGSNPNYTGLAEVAFSSVPEPSGAILMGLSLLGMALRRKRSNR